MKVIRTESFNIKKINIAPKAQKVLPALLLANALVAGAIVGNNIKKGDSFVQQTAIEKQEEPKNLTAMDHIKGFLKTFMGVTLAEIPFLYDYKSDFKKKEESEQKIKQEVQNTTK